MKTMNAFILSIVLFGLVIANAKPVLVVSDSARNFLQSGNPIDSFAEAFVATIDESSDNSLTELKNLLSGSYTVYASRNKSFRIRKENTVFDLSNLETNRANMAHQMLEQLVPQGYVNQFKLVSVDIQRSFALSQGVQIEGYTFNFKRVFNNRVVRNNKNYLVVRTDKNGFMKNAEIALQDLAVSSERIAIGVDYNEKMATLDSLINVDYEFIDVFGENRQLKKVRLDKIEVGSVAHSYCEVEVGSERKLFPCLSYASKLVLPNKESIGGIIDVPYSRKSWSEYSQNGTVRIIPHRR
jgi:ribosomal protein S8